MVVKNFKKLLAGTFLLIPSAVLVYYAMPSQSIYLILVGLSGVFSTFILIINIKNPIPSFIAISIFMIGVTHLFIALVSLSDQIKVISIISLALILFSILFYLD